MQGFSSYLCNLHCLITVKIPHLCCLVTGSSEHFTSILVKKGAFHTLFCGPPDYLLLNFSYYEGWDLHHSSMHLEQDLCASVGLWGQSVHCPAPPSTGPEVGQYIIIISLPNINCLSITGGSFERQGWQVIVLICTTMHHVYDWIKALTSLAQDPPMRKFPGMVGGLKARQLMLSSGGEVTSTSCMTIQESSEHG